MTGICKETERESVCVCVFRGLVLWGWVLICGTQCSLQVDSIRAELNLGAPSWCHRDLLVVGITVYPSSEMEKAMAPHSSTLAWKIPWMEEPGRLQFIGSLRVGHGWVTSLSLFTFMGLEKEMATHSSVLAWRIPGTGEPGGLPSMGSHRVGHDWSDLAAAASSDQKHLEWRVLCAQPRRHIGEKHSGEELGCSLQQEGKSEFFHFNQIIEIIRLD